MTGVSEMGQQFGRPTRAEPETFLTVHGNGSCRLGDPNKRHWVKTRLGREGKCCRKRFKLHSTCEEPLEQGQDLNEHSPDPQPHAQFQISRGSATNGPAPGLPACDGFSKTPETCGNGLKVWLSWNNLEMETLWVLEQVHLDISPDCYFSIFVWFCCFTKWECKQKRKHEAWKYIIH